MLLVIEENEIDGGALVELSMDDLKEVIKPLGVRVKVYNLIKKECAVDRLVNESHVHVVDSWDDPVSDAVSTARMKRDSPQLQESTDSEVNSMLQRRNQ